MRKAIFLGNLDDVRSRFDSGRISPAAQTFDTCIGSSLRLLFDFRHSVMHAGNYFLDILLAYYILAARINDRPVLRVDLTICNPRNHCFNRCSLRIRYVDR